MSSSRSTKAAAVPALGTPAVIAVLGSTEISNMFGGPPRQKCRQLRLQTGLTALRHHSSIGCTKPLSTLFNFFWLEPGTRCACTLKVLHVHASLTSDIGRDVKQVHRVNVSLRDTSAFAFAIWPAVIDELAMMLARGIRHWRKRDYSVA